MDQAQIVSRARDYIAHETTETFKAEVVALLEKQDWKELEDRFYRELEFGTAGLRGLIGGGSNRMNTFVVKRATQGLASYIAKNMKAPLSACIAYDSRHFSPEFAEAAALVFAANGIKVSLFSSMRPTPELSFAVRELKANSGIVITASHNPGAYNGYKAYWNDGAQIIPPHDDGITAEVEKVSEIHSISKAQALGSGLLVYIDEDIDARYVSMIKSRLFRPALVREMADNVKIVYSPLHGTGALHFERVMSDLGFSVNTVPEQREGNGDFPTVAFPNPEEAAALKMAVDLGKRLKADVVMATDPDADRLGIAVPDASGEFVLLSGNQLGSLLSDYILLSLKETGRLGKQPFTIKTVVTTDLQARIAAAYGARCYDCLTGFKWIAAVMEQHMKESEDFAFATEESYGFLVEEEVRDKDGISAAAMVAEMTLYWRSKSSSLLDRLEQLYSIHGFYQEKSLSKYFEGSSGMATMKGIMQAYRDKSPTHFGGLPVVFTRDMQVGFEWNCDDPEHKTAIDLPSSDVLQWRLENGTVVCVRPSGTEPKIKFYILARSDADSGLDKARADSASLVSAIEADIRKTIG